jgi:SRSO17 transposase
MSLLQLSGQAFVFLAQLGILPILRVGGRTTGGLGQRGQRALVPPRAPRRDQRRVQALPPQQRTFTIGRADRGQHRLPAGSWWPPDIGRRSRGREGAPSSTLLGVRRVVVIIHYGWWSTSVVTPEQIEQIRPRLVEFAGQMLGGLARSDQRAKGELYVRGLLTDGARKSMQPMAQRLGVDHQALQQFITSSTWDYGQVRANVASWAVEALRPDAYVVDDSGYPKDGKASPCVARQYSGTLGKTGNCQIGVSVQMVTDHASVAANWRLFCPASWDDTTIADPALAEQTRQRRARAGIPQEVRHREKWRLALDMLDQMLGEWGLSKRPVVGDSGYGDATEFRLGLHERGLSYILQVTPTATAHPGDATPVTRPYRGRGPRPVPTYPDPPATLRELALATGHGACRRVTWRNGTRTTATNPTAAMRSHFLAIRVRPANRHIPRDRDGTLPQVILIAEWPPDKAEPVKYWLSTLPTTTPLRKLVRLAKIRWRIEHDYRELKTGLGIDHFEGRSYLGWHRHVTLTVLAQAFCTLLRLDPKADAPA